MAQHKIPTFLSKKFNSTAPESRPDLLNQLEAWKASGMTEDLSEWLTEALKRDEAAEDTSSFTNEYETMQDYAWHKGYRTALRNLLNQIERDK